MDPVEEIKRKLDIVQIIGEYVELKQAGQSFKGKCPFHNEKTPSFVVNQDRQFYYCFGCNEGGDMFSFLQKYENLDFPEALKILAGKAGLTLDRFNPRATSRKTRLYDLLADVTEFWIKKLNSDQGKVALEYLGKRGLSSEIQEKFKLGYATDSWDQTLNYLKEKGYAEREIFDAGLIIRKNLGSSYYDRFRNRIIFPIRDIHGSIVGFTARALDPEEKAKYINSPETEIYKKSDVLYGFDIAKKAIKEKAYIILVEGNMDVIASHRAKVENVVAVSGTALTDKQLDLIKRYTENVVMCFDMDEAGQKAAGRSIDLAIKHGMNIKVVVLTGAKDPDEMVNQDPNLWVKALSNSKIIMQYYFDKYFDGYEPSDVQKKKEIARSLLTEINKLVDKIEQEHWLRELSYRLNVPIQLLSDSLPTRQKMQEKTNLKSVNNLSSKKNFEKDYLIKLIISLALNHFELVHLLIERLEIEMIDGAYEVFYKNIINWYNKTSLKNQRNLFEYLIENVEGLDEANLNSLVLLKDQYIEDLKDEELESECLKIINLLKKKYYSARITEIDYQIRQFESSGRKDLIADLYKQLQDINYKKNKL